MTLEEKLIMPKEKSRNHSVFLSSCILLWCLITGFSIWFFQRVSIQDQETYQKLMKQTDGDKINTASCYQAQQQRFNVNKHLLFIEEGNRLQLRIQSTSSELIFDQQGDKMEMIEHFKDIQCLMQEELFYLKVDGEQEPKQYIRYMKAETASYHYRTEEFIGEQVYLSRYLAPGHQFLSSYQDLKPIIQGVAQQVKLSLSNHDKQFKVQGFQGTIQNLGQSL